MRKLGILGGMSWESSAVYYRALNEGVRARKGGLASARLVMSSVEFSEIASMQAEGRWAEAAALLTQEARGLEAAGAEAIVLATNTMHKLAGEIEAAISVPFLHIADALAGEIQRKGSVKPLLLATRFTMEQPFYRDYLKTRHGIDTLVPDGAGRTDIHRIIYEELCRGIVSPASKARALEIAARAGGDGVIFGCTEIMLLLSAADFAVPTFDTTALHIAAALDFSLS
ncbi:MAG: aspartate/glutamate racemase family protein [Beijerinckiaceae bacterium]|jgi:aspartate racemase|nr:aspartate/glutamate racemase family protein [Beijerinckiaceae bacterium]